MIQLSAAGKDERHSERDKAMTERDRTTSAGGAGRAGSARLAGRLALLAAVAVPLAGCSGLFDVSNPGQILDDDLNNPESMQNIVVGMSADLSVIRDEINFLVARASDELAASGSYASTNFFGRGILNPDDVDFYWEAANQARFVAVDGIRRMEEVLGDDFQGNPLTARAHMFAAWSHVLLGENFCDAIFDGGSLEDRTEYFRRALEWADAGIPQAQQAGSEAFELSMIGSKAQAHVGLGNWAEAEQMASQIPDGFLAEAVYSDNSGREQNVWWAETHARQESSAYGTLAGSFNPADPRAPWIDCREASGCTGPLGAGGNTPHFRQEKFPDPGSDLPQVSWIEMRLIEAEAALRLRGDAEAAIEKMNAARAAWPELEPIDPDDFPSSASTSFDLNDPVWQLLDEERHLDLWLEGKRLWDLHRWDHPWLDGGQIVLTPEPRRDSCIPVSDSERQTNPNLG